MNDVENRMVVNELWPDSLPDSDFPKCDYCGEIIDDSKFVAIEALTLHKRCLHAALGSPKPKFGQLRRYACEYIFEDDINMMSMEEWLDE